MFIVMENKNCIIHRAILRLGHHLHAKTLGAKQGLYGYTHTHNDNLKKRVDRKSASNPDVAEDVGNWEWSELLKKEDWWAVWLDFLPLIAGMLIYFPSSGMTPNQSLKKLSQV